MADPARLRPASGTPPPPVVIGALTLTTEPAAPRVSRETTVRVHVVDNRGQPLRGAEVKLSGRQPEGGDERVEGVARDAGGGDYVLPFTPPAAGRWHFSVSVSARGDTREAVYEVIVGD